MQSAPGCLGTRRRMGSPARSSRRFGDGVDLLIVGSRGYGPVKRLVLGSTSDYLAAPRALPATRATARVAPAGIRRR